MGSRPIVSTTQVYTYLRWAGNLVPSFSIADHSLEPETKTKSSFLPFVKYNLSIVIPLNPMKQLNMRQHYKASQSAQMCGIGDKVNWVVPGGIGV